MWKVRSIVAAGIPAVACLMPLTWGQQGHDVVSLVRSVCINEVTSSKHDHSRWMYLDANKDPDKNTVALVVETSQGDLAKTIERDGHPLTPQEQEADKQRIHEFVTDSSVRAKQKHDHEEDAQKAASLTRMLPDAFLWTVVGRSGTETTLAFKPNPKFDPPTREARVFAAMEGTMVVNTAQKRIKTLKGKLSQDVDFGLGLLGQLEKGGTFEVERQQIGPRVWEITETHIHIHGHALIFKSIGEQQDEETSHYKPAPRLIGLTTAAQMLINGEIAKEVRIYEPH